VRLHEAVPGSELRVVPGAGHMIHHTAPDEVMAAIESAAARPASLLEASNTEPVAAYAL
jgi:pimeloyl-ACP methyl ester carboxylesterase